MPKRRDQAVVLALCQSSAEGNGVLRKLRRRGFRRSSLVHRFNKPQLTFLSNLLRPLAAVSIVAATILVGVAAIHLAAHDSIIPFEHLNMLRAAAVMSGVGLAVALLADQYGGIGVSVRAIAEFRSWLLGTERLVIVEAKLEDLEEIRNVIAEISEVSPVTFTLYEDWQSPRNAAEPALAASEPGAVTADRLRESARALADSQPVRKRFMRGRPLLKPLAESERAFDRARRHLGAAAKSEDTVDMAGEWLLDNAYIIKEQINQFRKNLPQEFYDQVPVLAEGPDAGLPRVYGIAKAIVQDTDAQLSTDNILKYVGAYQSIEPLTIGELWALPMMLRFALIAHLHSLVNRIERRQRELEWANFWANRLLTAVRFYPDKIPSLLRHIGREEPRPSPHLAMQIVEHLYDESQVLGTAQKYIERLFGMPLTEIAVQEQRSQAIQQVSLANTITSLRGLAQTDWRETYEALSVVDMILRVDPANIYSEMDFETRDQYRHMIEKMARWTGESELDIAHAAIDAASENGNDIEGHVGYYLIDRGRWRIAKKFGLRWPLSVRIQNLLRTHPTLSYVGSIITFTLVIDASIIREALLHGTGVAAAAALFVLTLLPASEVATQTVNWAISRLLPPRVLPKMSFENEGIPMAFKTMVVVPVMLLTPESIAHEIEMLEVRYLANTDVHLKYALLSDFSDAKEPRMPEDTERLDVAIRHIVDLDAKYGPGRFFLFHRDREWSEDQRVWMGRERKRGKLEDLNRYLMGDPRAELAEFLRYGTVDELTGIRFIITLDADTQLPRETARKMVATLAHPLNRPRLSKDSKRVERGYTIVQPRVTTSLPSATSTRFSQLFTDPMGIDPYTHAVSDTYQDLAGEGIYHGKGIYDLAAFNAILTDRFPDRHLLSHDLLEGSFVRTAFASDIELFDLFPKDYTTFNARQHRWTRGDWQIADWLFDTVPTKSGARERNPLSLINRWKILDNLRRSLLALSTTLVLLVGWAFTPHPAIWSVVGVLAVLFPVAIVLIMRILSSRKSAIFLDREPWASLGRALVLTSLLPEQAAMSLDAIVRVCYRRNFSRHGLLEWETAFESHLRSKDRTTQFVVKMSWISLVSVVIATVASRLPGYERYSIIPYCILWFSSPLFVLWLGQKSRNRNSRALTPAEVSVLRQYARRTWRFFDHFVGPATCWLPPDNYQEIMVNEVANRTSPTNIGLWLLSVISANDLGFIPPEDVARRLTETFTTLDGMERYEGHFLNWYDTDKAAALRPRYLSMVDSGNLLGAFWTLEQSTRDVASTAILTPATLLGINDLIGILHAEIGTHSSHKGSLEAKLDSILQLTASAPLTVGELVRRMRAMLPPAKAFVAILERPGDTAEESELLFWAKQLEGQILSWNGTIDRYLSWVEVLENIPATGLLQIGEYAHEWRREALASSPSLITLDQDQVTGVTALIAARERLSTNQTDLIEWLERLRSNYYSARNSSRDTLAQFKSIRDRADKFAEEMNMGFVYDPKRSLFYVGYNVDEHRMDSFYYDLLASEARLGSLCAVASGKVPAKHWVSLGRSVGQVYGKRVLMSWNGTMFEYLMPVLLTRLYDNTLLKAACINAVVAQTTYGRVRGVPWGISESGFSAIDFRGVYQYYAFGVPGLGLRRQADDMLVVAPYASVLALMIDPVSAFQNLRRLSQIADNRRGDSPGMLGQYGFYEAIDYSRQRNIVGVRGVPVRSYMAHHQGMSLLSINNVVNDRVMQNRFHADPRIRSSESLLHERIPISQIIEGNNDEAVSSSEERKRIEKIEPAIVSVDTWETPHPRTQLLSNGKYSVMVTNSGAGYSRWNSYDITRWTSDSTSDQNGTFCYVRDVETNAVWSTARQPIMGADRPQSYRVSFSVEKAELRRRDHGIEVITEIVVSPEDDAELRRITIINHSQRAREIELVSYVEIALNAHEADRAHPAFSKLFVETEAIPESRSLLAWRRPRASDEPIPYAVHILALLPGTRTPFKFETARDRFIGRGKSLSKPAALENDIPGTTGAVLDPIFSLRYTARVEPGERARIAFVTAAADSRATALGLAAKYADISNTNRAFDLAWNNAQLDLRHLRIQPNEAMRFQQLASYVLYSSDALRASQLRMTRNQLGKSRLWAYGISGDLPIVTITVANGDEIDVVRQLIIAHAYWRLHGLTCDLVIIDQEPAGYSQPLQDRLNKIVESFGHFTQIDRPGGIFLRAASRMAPEDLNLLFAAAHIVLVAARGSIAQQIGAINQQPRPVGQVRKLAERAADYVSSELPFQELDNFNGIGGFSKDGKEYSIYLAPGESTPAPWVNVMANPTFGALVSESGSGTAWYGNSQSNRLIPWSNDPVLDPVGDALYIRDEDLGVFWTVTVSPVRENEAYRTRHGQGYSTFEHNSHGIEQILTNFVPLDDGGGDPVRIQILHLKNLTQTPRKLAITSYVEWVLGTVHEETQPFIITDYDTTRHTLLARNAFNPDYGSNTAFLTICPKAESWTGDRTEFLGRCGSPENPAGMKSASLSRNTGAGMDPGGVVQTRIVLLPGEEKTVVIVLGEAANPDQALILADKYNDPARAVQALEATKKAWDSLLGTVQVETPDKQINALLNRWLLYQTISCRIWGRTGFYQSSGAFGFRDQLQDVLAVAISAPQIARKQILRAAARQFVQGDVQHWWHPTTGAGTRTRISDDLLWLPFVVAQYVRVTGDSTVLDEVVPFIEGAILEEGEQERYFIPDLSHETGTLLEHCRRAVNKGLTAGSHGLPLIGGGDWNDGLNRVGIDGKGESVWLAWFIIHVLTDQAWLLEQRGRPDEAAHCIARARELGLKTEEAAWDGDWYLRGFYDDGTPLGSHDSEEGIIDSLPQSWAVISGAANPVRAAQALESASSRLVREDYKAVLLFTPPFDKTSRDPGYVKGYIPGVRENGGQYTHGSLWLPMAYARIGDGDSAVKLLSLIGPGSHTSDSELSSRYRVEPYIAVADIYSAKGREGQGGWSWYTGASGWMYNIWLTEVLGLHKRGAALIIDPVIPRSWKTFRITVVQGTSTYKITVDNPKGVSCGVARVTIDGNPAHDRKVSLIDDGDDHVVKVTLGGGQSSRIPVDRPIRGLTEEKQEPTVTSNTALHTVAQ